jgi:drug/metabolite transporter (DMT)-like permease
MITKTALRPWVSAAAGSTFLVIAVTGVLLLFLDADRLEDLHGWMGLAFAIVGVMHLAINWRALATHLRQRRILAFVATLIAAGAALLLAAGIGEPDVDCGPECEAAEHVLDD